MEQIGFVSQQDQAAVEQMKQIWRECFQAEEEYLEIYFSTRYRPNETLVYRENGVVLGMLTLFPCIYRAFWNGKLREYNARYLFAVATLPSAQGKQISTKLLAYADKVLQEQGVDLALLAPATSQLYHFYEKRGYRKWFKGRVLSFRNNQKFDDSKVLLKPLSAEEYIQCRNPLLPKDTVLWTNEHLHFADTESRLYHGGLYKLVQDGKCLGLCNLYRYTKDEVIIKELLVEPGIEENRVIEALRGMFHDSVLTVRLPATEQSKQEDTSFFGMIRFYREKEEYPQDTQQAYLSFVLD